jgi:hypothetical protein
MNPPKLGEVKIFLNDGNKTILHSLTSKNPVAVAEWSKA